MSLIYAPWTDEQVAALNRWQECEWVHPFTCAYRDNEGHKKWAKVYGQRDHGILIATSFCWCCPVCDYTQNWAHDFMLEPPREHPFEKMRKPK